MSATSTAPSGKTYPAKLNATEIAQLSNSRLKKLKRFYASKIKKSYDGFSTTRAERSAKRAVQKASRRRNRK